MIFSNLSSRCNSRHSNDISAKNKDFAYAKNTKGITLVALVVTIVVLLILAGVTIMTLLGENGIITKAIKARDAHKNAVESEEQAMQSLADSLNVLTGNNGLDRLWPEDKTTKPYLPSGSFHVSTKAGENTLEDGLVIVDNSGNEYVWIEVPITADVYKTAGLILTDSELNDVNNLQKIRNDLKTYTSSYKNDVWQDYWYYKETTKDASNNTVYNTYSKDPLTEKEYKNNAEKTASDTWSIDTSIATGCGLNYADYTTLYKAMLKSVYKNGGFYIGRYEAGTETARSSHASIDNIVPLSKQDKYPINNVTCSEAQTIASRANSGSYNSSLLFGLQWDLVLKHLELKIGSSNLINESGKNILTQDSTSWGNYRDAQIPLTRGKYATYPSGLNAWKAYSENTDNYVVDSKKQASTSTASGEEDYGKVLLTTGASETFKKQNIYDLAGNTWEWTLERTSHSNNSCAIRGGSLFSIGLSKPASYRFSTYTTYYFSNVGFRVTIY